MFKCVRTYICICIYFVFYFYQILIYPLKYYPQKGSQTVSTDEAYVEKLSIKSWSINRFRYINSIKIRLLLVFLAKSLLGIP